MHHLGCPMGRPIARLSVVFPRCQGSSDLSLGISETQLRHRTSKSTQDVKGTKRLFKATVALCCRSLALMTLCSCHMHALSPKCYHMHMNEHLLVNPCMQMYIYTYIYIHI